jgi:dTDP-D-glucose 4,6-dehydratase
MHQKLGKGNYEENVFTTSVQTRCMGLGAEGLFETTAYDPNSPYSASKPVQIILYALW